MTQKYQSVNGQWPAEVPPLTETEARTAAKRLYRFGMGKPFGGVVEFVTGNRRNRITVRPGRARKGTLRVPAQRVMKINVKGTHFGGWKDLVHYLSHYAHWRKHPGHKPHDGRGTHAFIERSMIQHVVSSGWLDGKLKREPKAMPPVDVKAGRHARVLARIAAWEKKRRRVETALRKLKRQSRYYERALAA